MLRLFRAPFSTNVERVALALAHKGLDVESVFISYEDRSLVESVQRGMRSGAFERGQLLLPSEELIAEFQRWVAAGLD